MEVSESQKISPEILTSFGFTDKGVRKGLYRKDDFCLQEKQSGYYIVDHMLKPLNKRPIITIADLSIFHSFFIGTELY